MLSLILSLWIAQAAPVLPLGTELAPEPAISQQVTACCCGEKCECSDACQCQKSEDGKTCCQEGCVLLELALRGRAAATPSARVLRRP